MPGSPFTKEDPHIVLRWKGSDPIFGKTMAEKKNKRYNLVLPEELFDQIQAIADERGTTVLEILRRFIKLGLIAAEVEKELDSALIIRQGTKEREIVLI